MELLINYLKQNEVKYKRNFKLSKVSSVKIGGPADVAIFPSSEIELINLLEFLLKYNIQYKILGRMSNVLADDDGYRGAVIFTHAICDVQFFDGYLVAECGASLSSLIYRLGGLGFSGLEELFGIPASVGGAVYNNAGAFGKDISSALLFTTLYSVSLHKKIVLSSFDMGFSYRSSILKYEDLVLLSAGFAYSKTSTQTAMLRINEIKKRRYDSQPRGIPSLGSVFRRERNAAVSALIDRAGLKGFSVGGAEISRKHAGFIVNTGGANSADYRAVISYTKQKIFEKYGFYPTEEIEYL